MTPIKMAAADTGGPTLVARIWGPDIGRMCLASGAGRFRQCDSEIFCYSFNCEMHCPICPTDEALIVGLRRDGSDGS